MTTEKVPVPVFAMMLPAAWKIATGRQDMPGMGDMAEILLAHSRDIPPSLADALAWEARLTGFHLMHATDIKIGAMDTGCMAMLSDGRLVCALDTFAAQRLAADLEIDWHDEMTWLVDLLKTQMAAKDELANVSQAPAARNG